MTAASRWTDRIYGSERLAALTDGIFAVVLTLLVLDLKVPELPAGAEQILREDLLELAPNGIAWLVSFVLLARFWTVHHAMLATLEHIHLGTIVRNFGVLAAVSLVPFATALIGTYELEVAPVILFSTVMALTGISTGLFARHASRHPGLRDPAELPRLLRHWRYNAFGIPLFAALAMLLSVTTHPLLALAAWLVEPAIALAFARRLA